MLEIKPGSVACLLYDCSDPLSIFQRNLCLNLNQFGLQRFLGPDFLEKGVVIAVNGKKGLSALLILIICFLWVRAK